LTLVCLSRVETTGRVLALFGFGLTLHLERVCLVIITLNWPCLL